MEKFSIPIQIRWADIDPNFHVLHSKYYDYCANARLLIMAQYGITMQVLQEEQVRLRMIESRIEQIDSGGHSDAPDLLIKSVPACHYLAPELRCLHRQRFLSPIAALASFALRKHFD